MALISYFTCNESSGDTLHDTHGTNNLVNIYGDIGWHSPGHGSNSYAFDPLNGYPEAQAFTWGTTDGGPFSVACWVYMTATTMGPLFRAQGNDHDYHYIRVNDSYYDQPGHQSFSTGEWFHLSLVVSPTTYQYYINGSSATSGSISGWADYTTITLGAYSSGFVFPAYINDIYFFNEVLSQADVVKCMNNTYLDPTYKKGMLFKNTIKKFICLKKAI
jgi:hypothetical protein